MGVTLGLRGKTTGNYRKQTADAMFICSFSVKRLEVFEPIFHYLTWEVIGLWMSFNPLAKDVKTKYMFFENN